MKKYSTFVATRVVSEPGDYTRYDYVVICDNLNDNIFKFVPLRNSFSYPKELDYFEIHKIETLEDVVRFIDKKTIGDYIKTINPHTILECIRTTKELYNLNHS